MLAEMLTIKIATSVILEQIVL